MMLRTEEGKWHIDRTISLGTIVLLFIQITLVVWWGAKLDTRVCTIEDWKKEIKAEYGVQRPSLLAQMNKSWIDENKEALKQIPALIVQLQTNSKQLENNSKKLEDNQKILQDIHVRVTSLEKSR